MNSKEIFSHPDKPLLTHLTNVCDIGLGVYDSKQLKTLPWPDATIKKALTIALLTHDAGKANPWFQSALLEEIRDERLSRHALLSALIAEFQTINNLNKNGVSLKEINAIALTIFIIIRKHHGNFENLEDMVITCEEDLKVCELQHKAINYEFMYNIFKKYGLTWFDFNFNDLQKIAKENAFSFLDNFQNESNDCAYYLTINFLFSILISSDKGDCIFENGIHINKEKQIPVCAVDQFKESKKDVFKHAKLFDIRNEIYKETEEAVQKIDDAERILSINVPTGTGKTLASLNCALKLREKYSDMQRIIYCLPFTSIIDQNYKVFEEVIECSMNAPIVSSVLLKHHHLSPVIYKVDDENTVTEDKAEYLIEGWESELVVTTFYQLLHTIMSNNNHALRKFHNFANSVIILDEVQSIGYQYWHLVKTMFFEAAQLLNIRFILVTATLPLIFSEEKKEIKELAESKAAYFASLNRIHIDCSLIEKYPLSLEEFQKHLLEDILKNKKKRFLVVFNTIKSSIAVNAFLNMQGINTLYLSSNVIPKQRSERIISIKKKIAPRILISTQLIEAGVDIDYDIVYRDLAPLDCINQTAGRCNREGCSENPGVVKLVILKDDRRIYCSYIYEHLLLNKTEELIREKNNIYENELMTISMSYYQKIITGMDKSISINLIEEIKKMEYADAFEGSEAFMLIDQKFYKKSIFIELDENAAIVLRNYEEIINIKDRFERKRKFNAIKNKFYDYVITIPVQQNNDNKAGINIIRKPDVERYYDLQTGYKRDLSIKDYIF